MPVTENTSCRQKRETLVAHRGWEHLLHRLGRNVVSENYEAHRLREFLQQTEIEILVAYTRKICRLHRQKHPLYRLMISVVRRKHIHARMTSYT